MTREEWLRLWEEYSFGGILSRTQLQHALRYSDVVDVKSIRQADGMIDEAVDDRILAVERSVEDCHPETGTEVPEHDLQFSLVTA